MYDREKLEKKRARARERERKRVCIIGTFMGELTSTGLCIANEVSFGIIHTRNL